MRAHERKESIPFACGCVRIFPSTSAPSPNDTVWCPRHDWTEALDKLDEYRISCATSTCRVAKRFGEDDTEMRRSASRHATKYSHEVKLWKGNESLGSIGGENGEIPFEWVLRDRQERVAQTQRQLRESVRRVSERKRNDASEGTEKV